MQFNIRYMNTIKINHYRYVLIKADIIIFDDYVQNIAHTQIIQ